MPNLAYMLVNFLYLTGMSVWVGGSLVALLALGGAGLQGAGARPLARLHGLQAFAAVLAGAASAVKALTWEGPGWPFVARYVCLALMGAVALYGAWRVAPLLRLDDVRRAGAVGASRRIQMATLAVGSVALLLS